LFRLRAPDARVVKLAACFTGWEQTPVNLTLFADGIWQVVMPLVPGRYSYRFIVDGNWHDDPTCSLWEANPFGSVNAVIHIC
jgi:1,4-alpha-glucan branching enzyme